MNYEEYLNSFYIADFNTLRNYQVDCLCNKGVFTIYKECYQKLNDLNLFVMFSYELNKYAELVYTYFQEDHKTFISKFPPVFLPGCMYFHNPNLYFSFHEDSKKYTPNNVFSPTKEEMELVHDFVAKFVRKLIEQNDFKLLNYDLLNYCLKKDWDAWMPEGFGRQLESFPKNEQLKLMQFVTNSKHKL